jgi:hypothetical protein
MFDKKHTASDAELSVHHAAPPSGMMTLLASVRFFAAVLAVSVGWTLLGLTLYGAAVYGTEVAVTAAAGGETMQDGCGLCLWQYSVVRASLVASLVALSMVCAFAGSGAAANDDDDDHEDEYDSGETMVNNNNDDDNNNNEADDEASRRATFLSFKRLAHQVSHPKRVWIPLGAALLLVVLLFSWGAFACTSSSSALHGCVSALFRFAPALCAAIGVFILCDVFLLLAATSFLVVRITMPMILRCCCCCCRGPAARSGDS